MVVKGLLLCLEKVLVIGIINKILTILLRVGLGLAAIFNHQFSMLLNIFFVKYINYLYEFWIFLKKFRKKLFFTKTLHVEI